MSVQLATFASELVKLSEATDKERKGYGAAVAAALPFTMASAAADVPKGWIDKYVEQTIAKVPSELKEPSLRRGIARGAGRLGAGVLTSPVFLSGIQDLKSDDPHQKRRGYAKVVGSGLAFSTLKGGIEASVEHAHKDPKEILRRIRGVASSRGALGTLAALSTATAVAKATRAGAGATPGARAEKAKGTLWGNYGMPAVAGAATGAVEGVLEKGLETGFRGAKLRPFAAAAGGRAVAGALGATALTGLVKRFESKRKGQPGYTLKPSAKDPTVSRWQKTAAEQAPGMYQEVGQWARDRNDVEVYGLYKQVTADGLGERSQSRRAATYALQDTLQQRGHKIPTGPRQGEASAPSRRMDAGVIATLAVAPGVVASALASLPPTDRDKVLEDALDRVFIKNKMLRIEGDYTAWSQGMDPASAAYAGIGPGRPVVALPRKGQALPGIVAHEIGHMNPGELRRSTIASQLSISAATRGRLASIAIPLAVLAVTGDGKYATEAELERRATFLSSVGYLAGAAQLPLVTEEATASVNAVRRLRAVGDTSALSRVVRQAGPGFLTYVAPMAVPFVAAAQLRRRAKAKKT